MRERRQYLSGEDRSLHNGEVVSVQDVVHVRDLPSKDGANIHPVCSHSSQRTCTNKGLGSLTLFIYLL